MIDGSGRKINYIRISVSDRCQLRCTYCMPEEGVELLSHRDMLSFDEIERLCRIFAQLGINVIKITGGEPLCRRNVSQLIKNIKAIEGISEVTLTTNGVDLARYWDELCDAGLDSVNISIDTLDRELYASITRRDRIEDVLNSIRLTQHSGNIPVKINCVPMMNEQLLWDVASLAKDYPIHVRFIEMMPIGCGKQFKFISREETMKRIEAHYGTLTQITGKLGNGPADYYSLPGFKGNIGFISALSHKFCSECNRVRLTASGFLKTCLQFDCGVNLLGLLRSDATDEEIKSAICKAIEEKPSAHHFGGSDTALDESKIMGQIGG